MMHRILVGSQPKKMIALAGIMMFVVLCAGLFWGSKVSALGTGYYDTTGPTCDVNTCNSTSIRLVVGQTRYVQKTSVNVSAYYTDTTGELTLKDINFCPKQPGNDDIIQNKDYYSYAANYGNLKDGDQITQVVVTINGASTTYHGYFYDGSNPSCHTDLTIPLSGMVRDPNLGLYTAKVSIDPIDQQPGSCSGPVTKLGAPNIVDCDGIQNYFYLQETGANNYRIAQTGGIRGYEVTMQETAGASNIDYLVRFGSDCNVTTPTLASLYFYDMDNDGGSGAQIGTLKMRLYDNTENVYVPLSLHDLGDPTTYTPPSNNNVVGSDDFTAKPGHAYTWHVNNAYINNTIQVSTPYDGIYFLKQCPPPIQPPPPPPPPPVQPYFQATGGDVVSGASFSTTTPCASSSPAHIAEAGIVSWNEDGPTFGGAGTQYAARAMGYIQDFVTHQPAAGAAGTTKLSFSNDLTTGAVNTGNGLFGGLFGDAPCVDYWGTRPAFAAPQQPYTGGAVDGMNGIYYATTDVTIAASSLQLGEHVTIYVKGNVAIKGNITYNTAGWIDRQSIPSFRLIVYGSIFINNSVGTLDGLYVAVPDSDYATAAAVSGFASAQTRKGTIATCTTAGNDYASYNPANYVSDPIENACSNQLTVNGSLVAQQIWLLRAHGALAGTPPRPAEIINYDPELWLSTGAPSSVPPDGDYQSIVGLPPEL